MFNNRGSFIWRLIGVLLLIGLMIGGGVMAYRAGVAQGITQAPEVAEALSSAAESGQAAPMPGYGYGYGYPIHGMRPHFGFFPFGGIFGFILFIFLFFGLMRLIFRPRWYPMEPGMRGHWHGHPWGSPPWAKEGEADVDVEKKEDK